MDQLIVGNDYISEMVAVVGETRNPHIEVRRSNGADTLPLPYILTKQGPVFGHAAVIDYLQHRITAPVLLDIDPMRRGLQMTVFFRIVEHEFPKLLCGTATEARNFVAGVNSSLGFGKFYAGDAFSLCDAALYVTLQYIKRTFEVSSPISVAYIQRCAAYLAEIKETNCREHYEDDSYDE